MSEQSNDSQALLNNVVLEYMKDQKRQRRWRWIYRCLILGLLLVLGYKMLHVRTLSQLEKSKPHVGLIDVEGTIFEGQGASADNLAKSLNQAYKNKSLKALIIRLNSPGGSPVQADYMYTLLKHYKKTHPDVKTYAVCVDICASAAYYVAVGADEIYANPSSMVGSIGVIFNGFGFVDAMEKLGVSRRAQTAGVNKDFLDPFSPENPEQRAILQSMLDQVHQQFIQRVKEGRGDRLKKSPDVFSGLFWTGITAKKLGLIDGFASAGQLSRDTIKIKRMVNYTEKDNLFERFAKGMGSASAKQLAFSFGVAPGFK